jgi:hypothetical protein
MSYGDPADVYVRVDNAACDSGAGVYQGGSWTNAVFINHRYEVPAVYVPIGPGL